MMARTQLAGVRLGGERGAPGEGDRASCGGRRSIRQQQVPPRRAAGQKCVAAARCGSQSRQRLSSSGFAGAGSDETKRSRLWRRLTALSDRTIWRGDCARVASRCSFARRSGSHPPSWESIAHVRPRRISATARGDAFVGTRAFPDPISDSYDGRIAEGLISRLGAPPSSGTTGSQAPRRSSALHYLRSATRQPHRKLRGELSKVVRYDSGRRAANDCRRPVVTRLSGDGRRRFGRVGSCTGVLP